MNRPRRVRSPPFGYDPRVMSRAEPRPPPDFDDPYSPATPFEPPQSATTFVEPHLPQYQINYRDHRLPSTYRASLRDQAAYKILCITNINQKISDGNIKEALTSEFGRFGDISVSVCHDSGERLAYIYFRTYEEAREARHAKTRSIMFDRPIEIEPIYEPRTSPVDSPPPPPVYTRRRSMTPPEYYGINGPPHPPQPSRRHMPQPPPPPHLHHRASSPGSNYPSRYPTGLPAPMPYGRYYLPPSHLPPPSPYSSPPHDPYRAYPGHPPPLPPHHYPIGHHSYPPPYGPPPITRDRERPFPESHMSRSPRHEVYYGSSIEQRSYSQSMAHSSRGPPPSHSSSSHHPHPSLSPGLHHQSSSSSSHRRSSPTPQTNVEQQPRYMSREYRREKYSSDVYSNEPEEGRPSRLLFITNIDQTKSETEVREVFEPFGVIEDIEVRKIGPEISSALIRFSSMDCAYKAKTATNGKYIGNLKLRITYGKVSASRRLWIGGLGQSTTTSRLEDEFGNFGNITSLDYNAGRPYAYIEFDTANQAQFATLHLRGTFAADAERKLRIEYVDPVASTERNDKIAKPDPNQNSELGLRSRKLNETAVNHNLDESPKANNLKRSSSPVDVNVKRGAYENTPAAVGAEYRINATKMLPNNSPTDNRQHTPDRNELNNNQQTVNTGDSNNQEVDNDLHGTRSLDLTPSSDRLAELRSIRELVECCSTSWLGQLVLRNFNFPSKMYMCSGQKATIEKYITRLNGNIGEESLSEDQCPVLRITQRWRLHPQPKLEEVKRRMQTGNLGMLIITPRPDQSPSLSSPTCKTPQSSASQQGVALTSTTTKHNGASDKDGGGVGSGTGDKTPGEGVGSDSSLTQSRPLKNLISYLEQKDAAGVISLNAIDRDHPADGLKLMYAFPPGDFALNLLKRKAPNLAPDSNKEEFLLGVIVGGADTKL